MLRRSFRIGLTLGVLAGLAAAILKALQRRPESVPAPWPPATPWPPTPSPSDNQDRVVEPAAPEVPDVEPPPDAAAPEPAAPPEEPPVSTVPPEAPEPEPATEPEAAAPPATPATPATRERPLRASKATKATKATKKAAAASPPSADAGAVRWVEPQGGICPTTHPVKAKLASRLFHLPGMFAYDRTNPDRCYEDQTAAEADGFTKAKR